MVEHTVNRASCYCCSRSVPAQRSSTTGIEWLITRGLSRRWVKVKFSFSYLVPNWLSIITCPQEITVSLIITLYFFSSAVWKLNCSLYIISTFQCCPSTARRQPVSAILSYYYQADFESASLTRFAVEKCRLAPFESSGKWDSVVASELILFWRGAHL